MLIEKFIEFIENNLNLILQKRGDIGSLEVNVEATKKLRQQRTEEILKEIDISPTQIEMLRTMYATVKGINPSGSAYKNLITYLDELSRRNLLKLSRAKIKWLSPLAKNRLKFAENLEKTLDLCIVFFVY